MSLVFRLAAACLIQATAAEAQLQFRERTLATELSGGYQTALVDVNGDGRLDIVALATGMTELLWFENPDWTRRVLAAPIERPINLAAADTDGDGVPEFVVAAGWSNVASKSPGTVLLLTHNGDPRQKWSAREIDRLPTSHRIRVMKLAGKPAFVNAPLTGADAEAPDYRVPAPLVLYRPGEWKRETVSNENRGVVHGLNILDWNRDGREDIVTASFEGVHWFGGAGPPPWKRKPIVPGDTAPWPKSGASDALAGRTKRGRFLVTVEPWHGNQVCVYWQERGAWTRHAIDDSDPDVHALAVADLDGDGNDDIVSAVRGKPGRVVIYLHRNESWTRQVVDEGGITAAQCSVADLNGDGRPDLACIGSATANLKLYENLGLR